MSLVGETGGHHILQRDTLGLEQDGPLAGGGDVHDSRDEVA